MSDDPDGLQVRLSKGGDKQAFGVLVNKYYEMVYVLSYGVLNQRESALDAVQDAFIKAYNEIRRFEEKSKFKTWLYRIAVNTAIDHQRRIRHAVPIEPTDHQDEDQTVPGMVIEDDKPGPLESAVTSELRTKIQKALMQLTAEHRSILVLREWQGASYEEIAEALDCSIGTVMSRLFYARKKMAEILGPIYKSAI